MLVAMNPPPLAYTEVELTELAVIVVITPVGVETEPNDPVLVTVMLSTVPENVPVGPVKPVYPVGPVTVDDDPGKPGVP